MALQESASLYPIRNISCEDEVATLPVASQVVSQWPVLLCSPLCSSALVLLCSCAPAVVKWAGTGLSV